MLSMASALHSARSSDLNNPRGLTAPQSAKGSGRLPGDFALDPLNLCAKPEQAVSDAYASLI